MGNAWGIDGTQNNPPPLSAWSKVIMGWLKPTEIKKAGFFRIEPANQGNVCREAGVVLASAFNYEGC